ncbi:MAG: response regulator [Desulfuromonadales bacterium]|nr:response regulator [Desulfuromonadales bacterium]
MSRYAELFRAIYSDTAGASAVSAPVAEKEFSCFTVLLVDDEPSVLKALNRVFLDEPCQILTAENGRQALQLLEQQPVQLVISDHHMPGLSGADFLRELRNRWPDTLRIMLTGYANTTSIMKVVEEIGIFKFITKPWNDDDLRLTVRLAFKQYQLQEENRRLRDLNRLQQTRLKDISTLLYDNREAQTNLLQNAGLLSAAQLQQVAAEQLPGESLADSLLRLQIISEESLLQAFQSQLNLPAADLKTDQPAAEMIRFLPLELCQRGQLLPLKLEGRYLHLAMADPSDMLLREHIELLTGLQLWPLVASRSAIERCLQKALAAEDNAMPGTKSAPRPAARPQIPQLQVGLAAIRQGLESVEDALQALSGDGAKCPLCGDDIDPPAAE